MESIMEYTNVWAVYLAAGLIGLWCWGRMAIWVKHYGVIYHLYSALGAVLIFTPVPVSMDSVAYLAPGFLAVAVALLSHDQTLLNYYGIWYLITLVLALITVAGCAAAGLMPAAQSSAGKLTSKPTQRQKEASERAQQRQKAHPQATSQPSSDGASKRDSLRREPRL